MKRPAKPFKLSSTVAILVLLVTGLAGQAFADTKPKYVYVANSGDSFSQTYEITKHFQVTATAMCTNYACASPISITGSFTVSFFPTWVKVDYGGSMALSDPQDLASSPLVLTYGFMSSAFAGTGLDFGPPSPASHVSLSFPFAFSAFPPTYSGGMLCTVAFTSGCSTPSSIIIAPADQSPSLLAITGGTPLIATIQSGSITLAGSTQGSNSVSGYAIDSATGALTLLPGSPFAAGSDPVALAVNPSNKFIYVANHLSNNVSVFSADVSTGALSQVAGSPFSAGSGPSSIAVDPSGKFVYVTNQGSNNVSAYTTDSETGVLTPINGSPIAADVSPISLTMDPLGRFLYVTSSNLPLTGQIPLWGTLAYSIDSATGAITQLPGSQPTAPGPLAAAIDPTGKSFLSTADFEEEWGLYFSPINRTTGGLTGPIGASGSVFPGALAIHPSGKFVYVTDVSFDYIVAFTFDSTTGALNLVPGSAEDNYGSWDVPAGPYATGYDPTSIAIDPSGKFAYVTNAFSNDISGFNVDSTTGALKPIAGTTFEAGVGPSSVAIVSASTLPFDTFKARAEIDEDRKTSFRVEGFFKLGAGSDGIYPLSEIVQLQVGSYSVTIPANSFTEKGHHEFEFEGTVNGVNLRIAIHHVEKKHDDDKRDNEGKHDHDAKRDDGKHVDGNDYLFTAEGKGNILTGIANPLTVGLSIGDDEGTATVNADIDK